MMTKLFPLILERIEAICLGKKERRIYRVQILEREMKRKGKKSCLINLVGLKTTMASPTKGATFEYK